MLLLPNVTGTDLKILGDNIMSEKILTVVTTVEAKGTVKVDYDQAEFYLSFSEKAPMASAAKTKLKMNIDKFDAALAALKEKGLQIVEGSLKNSVYVNANRVWEHHRSVTKGYVGYYSIRFTTENMEMVNEVYDTLCNLNINDMNLNTPQFKLKNADSVKKEALQKAWDRVKEMIQSECEVLGVNREALKVAGWEVGYNGYAANRRSVARSYEGYAVAAAAASSGEEAIDINAGQADVTVSLTVDFAWNK